MTSTEVSKRAEELYKLGVESETPNRTQLDKLVDFLRVNSLLLYPDYFNKGFQSNEPAIGAWHGQGANDADEALAYLTTLGVWGWAVMEDAVCLRPPTKLLFKTTYPDMVQRFLRIAGQTLKQMAHTPSPIVRRAIQALTRFWSVLYRHCTDEEEDERMWMQAYKEMSMLALTIRQIPQHSEDPATLMHVVKFLEAEATIFSSAPQRANSKGYEEASLDLCPDQHPYLNKAQLEDRGKSARQMLMSLLPNSETPRLFNTTFITGIVASHVYLMNQRPQFIAMLLQPLMDWHQQINTNYNSMVTTTQASTIQKTLRLSLYQLYLQMYGQGLVQKHCPQLEHVLDTLSGTEWITWQSRQARRRKYEEKRARERSKMALKQQQQQQQQQQLQQQRQQHGQPGPAGVWDQAREMDFYDLDDEAMADQPAPMLPTDANSFSSVGPLPADIGAMLESLNRIKATGKKRPAHRPESDDEEEDEDEEQQFRRLEESTKRVKLEADQVAAAAVAAIADISATAAKGAKAGKPATGDVEMDDAVSAALDSGPFVLHKVDDITPEQRDLMVRQAFDRVVDASKRVKALVENMHVQGGRDVAEINAPVVLPNGLSTNAGVLEDAMLVLVRLISNFYIMQAEAHQLAGSTQANNVLSQGVRSSVEGVLSFIVESPRAHYRLAQLLLYELWLAVVIANPELKESTVGEIAPLALYNDWCERFFDSILESATKTALAAEQPAQVVPGAAEGAAAVPPANRQPQHDRLLFNYIVEAPSFPPSFISKFQECLVNPRTARMGIATLRDVIALRPPVRREGLRLLIANSSCLDSGIRTACIIAVKKHHGDHTLTPWMEKLALESFRDGLKSAAKQFEELDASVKDIENPPDHPMEGDETAATAAAAPEDPKALAAKARAQGESNIYERVLRRSQLFLALCTRNAALISKILEVYAESTPQVQAMIRFHIKPMVQSLSHNPAKVLPVLRTYPPGADPMVLRIVEVLTLHTVPSKELVQTVIDIYLERKTSPRIIAFVLNGMTREQLARYLPDVVAMMNNTDPMGLVVAMAFERLTTSYQGRPSCMSPTELLVALHAKPVYETGIKSAEGAVGLCIDRDAVFSPQILAAAVKMLLEQDEVSPLLLRTGILCHKKHRSTAGLINRMLNTLVERRVWQMQDDVWKGFVLCCFELLPATFKVMFALPYDRLKEAVEIEPRLVGPLQGYTSKLPRGSLRNQYKWLLEL